jgi:hypothetical protein
MCSVIVDGDTANYRNLRLTSIKDNITADDHVKKEGRSKSNGSSAKADGAQRSAGRPDAAEMRALLEEIKALRISIQRVERTVMNMVDAMDE